MHWPEGRSRPCARAWPKPWVQLWHWTPAQHQGADLALSCLFGLGGCLQRAGAAPLRALGLREQGSAGITPALPGELWPGGRRVCLWGWAWPVQGMSGLLLKNRAPLHPVMAMQGLQILCLLQGTKTQGTMRS